MYKKIVAQTTLYGVSNTLSKLSGLILLPLYTNLLPLQEYGLLGLFETLSIFIIAISGMGLRTALPRWYWLPEKTEQQKDLFFTVVSASILFAVLISVMSYFVSTAFSGLIFQTQVNDRVIGFFMLSLFFRILNELPFLILRINQKAMAQTVIQAINLGLTVLLTYYFLAIARMGIEGIFISQMISAVITSIITVPTIRKYMSFVFLPTDFKAMMRFGLPLALSSVLSILLSLSDRFILGYFINLEEVGTFSLASKVANVLQLIVITSFFSAYTHIFYQGMNKGADTRLFTKVPTWFWLSIVLCALGLTLFGKEIIVLTIYSNPEYWNSIDVLPLLVTGLLLGGLRQIFVLDLSYHHQTKAITVSVLASGIINVILNLILIPYWKSNGAALATAVTQFLVSVFLYLKIRKISLVTYELRKMVVIFVIAAAISWFAPYLNHWPLIVRLSAKMGMMAVFLGSLWVIGFFDAKEMEILKGFWTKWKDPTKLVSNIKQYKQH
ncbi:MAG: oligosaccharide flippase family protein [Breznakibacter sp.]